MKKQDSKCTKNNLISNSSLIMIGELDIKGYLDYMKRVYHPNGLAPSLMTMQGGGRQPKIIVCKKLGDDK